jgi:hypothetical protein
MAAHTTDHTMQHLVDLDRGHISREIFVNEASTSRSKSRSLLAPGCWWGMRARAPRRVITSCRVWGRNQSS